MFQAAGDGYFNAYDAGDGKRLLHHFIGYERDRGSHHVQHRRQQQYVAILAGYGGSGMITIADAAAVRQYANNGRLIVFKLGGGAVPAATEARRTARSAAARQHAAPLSPRTERDGIRTVRAVRRLSQHRQEARPCCRI